MVLLFFLFVASAFATVALSADQSFRNPWAEHNAKMVGLKEIKNINKDTVGATCLSNSGCNIAAGESCCASTCVQGTCCGTGYCSSGDYCCTGGNGCAPNGNTECSASNGVCSSCPSGTSCNGSNCKNNNCFASTETVELESGKIKALSDVELGDRILTASLDGKNTQFSEVIALPHGSGSNDVTTTFAHIHTSAGRDIKMTLDHLILAKAASEPAFHLVQAGTLKVGQLLATIHGDEVVTSSSTVVQKGISTVVTSAGGLIVVNGIMASPFAINHGIVDSFYNIHRMVYYFTPKVLASSWVQDAVSMFGNTVVDILS